MIYANNPLEINGYTQMVSWQVLNQRPDTLVLSSLTIQWPTYGSNSPKLDYVRFGSCACNDSGYVIWDGNNPCSPSSVDSWTGYSSDRMLGPYLSDPKTVTLTFTRALNPGTYALTLTFHDDDLDIDCSVSTSRDWQP